MLVARGVGREKIGEQYFVSRESRKKNNLSAALQSNLSDQGGKAWSTPGRKSARKKPVQALKEDS